MIILRSSLLAAGLFAVLIPFGAQADASESSGPHACVHGGARHVCGSMKMARKTEPDNHTKTGHHKALPEGNPERGETIYQNNCSGCHGKHGEGASPNIRFPGKQPPPLNADGHAWKHPQNLRVIIERGTARGMPDWEGTLSATQISDVLAYIKTWWPKESGENH